MSALRISTGQSELDVGMILGFLGADSYWAKGMSRALLDRALAHSLCFGGYLGAQQVAFARVVTDRATFAHLKDVFVLPAFRDRGFGVAIMAAVMAHPDLQTAAFTLGTLDAHALSVRFGFTAQPEPHRAMVRPGAFLNPDGNSNSG